MKNLKAVLLFLILFTGFWSAQSKAEQVIIEKINKYEKDVEKDATIKKYKFQVTGENKLIHYEYAKRGNEIISVYRYWDEEKENLTDTYSDYFLLKNNSRVYGRQGQSFKMKSEEDGMGGWSCEFWFNKNKVIYMTSTGHGKTELDDWDYDLEFKENFEYMIKEVKNNIQKNK